VKVQSRKSPENQLTADRERPFEIAFVLMDEFSFMAFTSAIEPLRSANRLSGKFLYSWELFSSTGDAVRASNGMTFQVKPLSATPSNVSLVLICGGAEEPDPPFAKLNSWLRWMAANRVTLGSISTASYVLANAGLLAGYQCTIHWESLAVFRERYSSLDILDDIFVIDGDRITCSGGTAAMDMMLQLIGEQHGADLASSVAAQFIHERVRRDGDRQVMDPRHRLGIVHPRL
jgi:AraC family transcriptional regulator, glycine betaine-responsive activator